MVYADRYYKLICRYYKLRCASSEPSFENYPLDGGRTAFETAKYLEQLSDAKPISGPISGQTNIRIAETHRKNNGT